MSMTFSLISQDKVVAESEVDELLIPTTSGQIGVLPGHVDLVTEIQTGEIIAKKDQHTDYFAVFGGVAEIHGKEVTVLADRAEHAADIDLAAAEAAKRQAEELVKNASNHVELSQASALLERNVNRIKIAQIRHHTRRPTGRESLQ